MPTQVAQDPTRITLQIFQRLAHALELLCMGVATRLHRETRGDTGIGFPQLHPSLLRQRHQLVTRTLVKLGIRRVGDGPFHDDGIDSHAPDAVCVDGPGLLASPDRLGQQPFDTLFPDPAPTAGQRGLVYRRLMPEERLAPLGHACPTGQLVRCC